MNKNIIIICKNKIDTKKCTCNCHKDNFQQPKCTNKNITKIKKNVHEPGLLGFFIIATLLAYWCRFLERFNIETRPRGLKIQIHDSK